MADWDRMKQSLFALIRAALPRVDYYALYYGKVVSWHTDQTVDVQPNDPKLPSISGVLLRTPAGFVWDVNPATETSVLVGWENGDPARPFALCAFTPGAHVRQIVVNADDIVLGGTAGAQKTVLGDVMRQILATISTHAHPPIPSGGGPVLPSLDLANLPDPRASNVSVR